MRFLSLGKSDVDLILAIQKDNFSDGWNKRQLLSAFDSDNFYAVGLFEGEKAVGFITYSFAVESADIEGVVVLASQRKKGYGKLLVKYALDTLKALNVEKVLLEVREGNLPAIALYSACGFRQVSVRKKYYQDGENALILIKEI